MPKVISSDIILLHIDAGLPAALLQGIAVRGVKNALAFLLAVSPLSLVDLARDVGIGAFAALDAVDVAAFVVRAVAPLVLAEAVVFSFEPIARVAG